MGGFARGLHHDRVWVTGPVFAAVVLVAWLGRLRPSLIRLPQNRRLVPQYVPSMGPVWGAAQFGFEMGTGVRTFVTAASPYILVAWLAFFAMPWTMLLLGALGFGIGRGIPNVLALRKSYRADADIDTPARLSDIVASAGLILLAVHMV